MAAKPQPRRRKKDGTIAWRQPFRLHPGADVTYETFDTQEDALAFGRLVDKIGGQAARDARTASTTTPPDVPSLTTWFDEHLTQVASHATTGTVDDYRRVALRTWLPRLGSLPLTAITTTEIRAWVTAQRGTETLQSVRARHRASDAGSPEPAPRHYSAKSIANAHGLLSATLAAAVDAGWLPGNPARGIRLPSDSERTEMVILTASEYKAVHDTMPPAFEDFFDTLYASGMRFGEATALFAEDLGTRGPVSVLRVARAWKVGVNGRRYLGSPKTRRGRREVSIPEELAARLRTRVKALAPRDLLFSTPQGGRLASDVVRSHAWLPALEASGVTKRPRIHDLRHTHASLMLAAGMDLLTLQYRLGHESLKTTADRYGHLLPGALEESARLAGDVMPGHDVAGS